MNSNPALKPLSGTFSDAVEPTSMLVTPNGINGYSETLLDSVDQIMSLVSPSAWILEIVYGTLTVDPFQEVVKRLGGDWNYFADCADLWRMLGDAHRAIATNVRRGNAGLDQTWNGRAADAAFAYFHDLTGHLEAMGNTLQRCAKEYERLTLLVWYAVKGLGAGLQALTDLALTMAIAAAAGGATAGTGFGPAVAAAIIALQATRMIRVWDKIADYLTVFEAGVFGVGGVVAELRFVAEHLPRPPASPGLSTAPAAGDWNAHGHGF